MNELTVRIVSTGEGSFVSEALRSPFRELPRHPFGPPLHPSELDDLEALTQAQIAALAKGDPPPEPPPHLAPEPLGTKLFSSALGGDVGALYRRCRDAGDVRLRLVFDPDDPQAPYLSALPWERMFDPVERCYPARQRATPLARDVVLRHRLEELAVELPLRILVVDAAPAGMAALDFKSEKQRMQEALAPLRAERLVDLAYASTLAEMRDKLLDRGIHVLHFMGHGGYLDDEGRGLLGFETADGGLDRVDGGTFGEFVAGAPDLRLVVLNACHGARYAGGDGRPFDHGVAGGVLQRTGRSVLAMQHAISDPAAISFSRDFYRRLAKNDPLDVAVGEARLHLTRGPEWATPVLFLSAPDGQVFAAAAAAGRSAPAARPRGRGKKNAPAPVRLGIRSMNAREGEVDHGRFLPHLTEECLDLRRHFDGRFIREDRLWLDAVLPEVRDFLEQYALPGQPLDLLFAAHLSVAFAAGWTLDAKFGVSASVGQPTSEAEPTRWRADDGTALPAGRPPWQQRPDLTLAGDAPDLALAIGVSQEIGEHVRAYVERERLPIGRIVDAVPAGGAGWGSVAGGAHALQLAQALSARASERRPHESGGRLHVFAAAPAGLAFQLGRIARSWGALTLYEHAFGAAGPARYRASLLLPPPGTADPPRGW